MTGKSISLPADYSIESSDEPPSPAQRGFLWYNFLMKLIVGLGNPGEKYNFTRHNAGFLAVDFILKKLGEKWATKPKFNAEYAKISISGEDVLFIKPQGYYNDSGRVVAEFMRYYKILLSDLLVICDDFNLEFGKIRLRKTGSAGGNNGLKSIIANLNTEDFSRLRIGTGNDELRQKIGDMDFVLSKFTPTEKESLVEALVEIYDKVSDFCS